MNINAYLSLPEEDREFFTDPDARDEPKPITIRARRRDEAYWCEACGGYEEDGPCVDEKDGDI